MFDTLQIFSEYASDTVVGTDMREIRDFSIVLFEVFSLKKRRGNMIFFFFNLLFSLKKSKNEKHYNIYVR